MYKQTSSSHLKLFLLDSNLEPLHLQSDVLTTKLLRLVTTKDIKRELESMQKFYKCSFWAEYIHIAENIRQIIDAHSSVVGA